MGLTKKAIRRLGLGDAAGHLLAPLAKDSAPLPSPEEARALLTALRPDAGSSALTDTPLPPLADEVDVDVIVPAYNMAPYLSACLDSVFSQEAACRFRVIAVDDGSTDESGAILDACADPRLTVIHQENRGLAGARNRGIEAASAPYLYYLDADDMLAPGCLQALYACAREEDAALVEGAFCSVRADGSRLRSDPHAEGPLPEGSSAFGFVCGKLFRRELFSRIRFPEGYLFEDSILSQLLLPLAAAKGWRTFGISNESFYYRQNAAGIVRSSRGSQNSIDSLWVTLRLYRDRQTLGLTNDQRYYEYILNMLVLTRRRTEALEDEVGRAVFVLWREFLLREFPAFSTGRPAYRMLEDAVRGGDYGRYRLFCSLH